jgi:hypothetical protein
MRRTACALACLSACLGAGPAVAQSLDSVAPPGASAIDEYAETIPQANGNRPVRDATEPTKVLTVAQRQALAAQGADGRQAAVVAELTTPASAADGGTAAGGAAVKETEEFIAESRLPDTQGESGLSALLSRALGGSGGGLGAVLPILLAVTLLLAAAAGLHRRRAA